MPTLIPLLACKSLAVTLDFYETLGFQVTYRQEKPYLYGAVQRGDLHLHFTRSDHPVSCLIMVADVGVEHRAIADALRAAHGRVPTAGLPRVTRLRPGQTRFSLFDPDGNTLVYINHDEPDVDYERDYGDLSPLERALENAAFLRDTYTDDAGAARVLDKALARHADAPAIERARALAARGEIAVALGDMERAHAIRAELAALAITEEDRLRFGRELAAADALERWLSGPGGDA